MKARRVSFFTSVISVVRSLSVLSLFCATSALAQTVIVQNGLGEKGYGWMFAHAGTCYAVLPRHVAGPLPRVTVTTATPVASGTGTVIAPFWEGIDLALIVVRGEAAASCTGKLDTLRPNAIARRAVEASLLRILPTGEEERVPLRVENRGYLTFEGVSTSTAEIAQGTSGAFAFVGEQPIGMAYASTGPDRATFMRVEEIHMHLDRYLSEQGGAYAVSSPGQEQVAGEQAATLAGGVPLELEGASMAPTNPAFAPENLLEDGLFVFEQRRHMRIVLRVAKGGVAAVRRLRLTSPAGGEYALPKAILVQYSLDGSGQNFREWTRGQMAPDGVFDTGEMAARNMRRIAITILDTWSNGPVALDQAIAD